MPTNQELLAAMSVLTARGGDDVADAFASEYARQRLRIATALLARKKWHKRNGLVDRALHVADELLSAQARTFQTQGESDER